MDDDLDAVLADVGPRLRETRRHRGRTLAEVAAETGLSISTLSRLESGARRASLDVLLPLARTYRVPLDDLVGAPAVSDPRVHPRPVRRNGMVYVPLTHPGSEVLAFKMILPPHDPDAPLTTRRHQGYEWVYVLAGVLRLQLDDVTTLVRAGEAAELDTRRPHALASGDGAATVELLAIVSPQGERIHLG
ncbi:XRE family transcriptional regulator [Sediminihabitans luteus]|uniref:XRE family transcriptional regulator n=1 Tax=Sediminihabitans luteus TaxID=1138585 RepID=A0A2M9CES8_9CELL|nr:XRE family transcriptional regulator [Sediminihabitans luteus]PJJ70388.1 XRE family transcriptional regulator [Sediminihabitans luteus]